MKKKFLNKIGKNDYNNKLEEVLANKNYSEEVKNTLLSMFYKIENGYNDYKTVKRDVFKKSVYIQKLIDIIKNDCDKIEFLKINGRKKSYIDAEKKEIYCKPIELEILYCLAKIQKRNIVVNFWNEEIERCVSKVLNTGNNINMMEVLRDFNGFSWNIVEDDIEDFYCNLIYQNIIYLANNEFVDKWTNNYEPLVDYFELFQCNIEQKYGKNLRDKIIAKIVQLAIIMECRDNAEFKKNIFKLKKSIDQENKMFKDKANYLINISEEKKLKEDEIKKIDKILNDKELLAKEYKKRNEKLPLEKKIFSIRIFKKNLASEREQILNEIKQINENMKPHAFFENKKSTERKVECLNIEKTKNYDEEIYAKIIELQRDIIDCINIDVKNAQDKQELMELIYKYRYYIYLPIEKETNLYNAKELNLKLQRLTRAIIQKATYFKIITKITDDENANYNIVKNIMNSNIINYDEISIKISPEKSGYVITIFDEDIIEKQIKLKNIAKENIKVKINKKVKLFNMNKK